VARLAFDARIQVDTVIPRHARKHLINSHPRNGLLRLRKLGELLNRRLVLRDRDVAFHAGACGGKSHKLVWSWIDVALLAFQAEGQVLFVTISDGLHRRRVFRRIVGDHLLRSFG